jgi:hypothetical protein
MVMNKFVNTCKAHNLDLTPAFLDKDGQIEDNILKVMKNFRDLAEANSNNPWFQKTFIDPRIGNNPELTDDEQRLCQLLGESEEALLNAKRRVNAENMFNGQAFESIVETWFKFNRHSKIIDVKDVRGIPIEKDYGRDFQGRHNVDGLMVSIQCKDRRNPKQVLSVKKDLGTWCALDYNDGVKRDKGHRILFTTSGGIHYKSREKYFNNTEVTVVCAYPGKNFKDYKDIDIQYLFKGKGFWEDLMNLWGLTSEED